MYLCVPNGDDIRSVVVDLALQPLLLYRSRSVGRAPTVRERAQLRANTTKSNCYLCYVKYSLFALGAVHSRGARLLMSALRLAGSLRSLVAPGAAFKGAGLNVKNKKLDA